MPTTFSFPLQVKRPLLGTDSDSFTAHTLLAKTAPITVALTGLAAGTTTIPLMVLPAGAIISNAFLDIRTAFDNTAGVNVQIGTPTNVSVVFDTTVNTTGRRSYTATAAQISVNSIPLTADTTIAAIVSITTSAVTVGDALLTIFVI